MVTSLRYADGAVLVTEPTKFGLNRSRKGSRACSMFGIPFGVIINKDDGEENIVKSYCEDRQIEIIGLFHIVIQLPLPIQR